MSKPDWMNFDEDEGDNNQHSNNNLVASDAVPVPTANSHGDHLTHPSAGSNPYPSSETNDGIPLFLREDAAVLQGAGGGGGAPPAFLSGMPGADESTGRDASLTVDTATDAVRNGPGGCAVMYADQPSAALLEFTGDSGEAWALHRVRILGKGNYGCATLYSLDATVAEQPTARRAVVVKDINVQTMLNPTEDMAAVQNELRVLRSAVGHPNLVQYVDALFDARPVSYPMCFLMMEYAAGGDLAALLERSSITTAAASPALAEDRVAAYFIQTAVALYSLHTEHSVLHRDVKPHNIFLLEDGVTVRLGDFGIATQLDRVGEKAKEACGSPYFMAPEIFEEKSYDSAADVWSLGVVFYQLLARQLPFVASSVAALGTLVRRGQFVRLSDASVPSTTAAVSSSSTTTHGGTAGVAAASVYSRELRELIDSLLTVDPAARPTLRRVLRSRYVREHLRCVPASILQAKKPVLMPSSSRGTSTAVAAPRFAAESLYETLFGADVVADAVAHALFPGVLPVVNRISHTT
jgi:serine/threonine protein kinase